MSQNEVQKIKSEFERLGITPIYLEHEPVITSEDAARTRGFELKQGIKAILFTDQKGNFVVCNVPADKKANDKKVAEAMAWSKNATRIATPEQVFEITGCEIGSVPPFGHKSTLPLLVDESIFLNSESAFNIGLRTHSVKIKTAEMRKVFAALGAVFGSFAKD